MISTIASAAASAASDTGWGALATYAVIPTVVWGIAAGWVCSWIAHRYQSVEDSDGFERADLGDAVCSHCERSLSLSDVAPIRSWACVGCHHRLPITVIGTQLAVLIGALAMLMTWGAESVVLPFMWLVPVVITAAVIDIRTMLIPKRLVWVGFGVGLASISAVALFRGNPETIVRALIGAALLFGFLFITHVVSPAGMGFGDVRLAAVLGLYLGWIDIRLPLFGLLIGNVAYLSYAIPARISKGKLAGRYSPFGPGLALGTLIAVVMSSTLTG